MKDEVTARVSVTLLIEMINYSKRGNATFKQLGVDPPTMSDLASMNVAEIHELAESPFVEYTINHRALNQSVQRILHRRKRDDVLNRAITLGASRVIMKTYANMSSKEFNQRRTDLNMNEIRSRPTILSDDEYDKLARQHNKFGQHNPITEKLDHLRCLIHLSESLAIDISRIYQYFYSEQQGLFVMENYK